MLSLSRDKIGSYLKCANLFGLDNLKISIDTRELSPDTPSCFFAIKGLAFDGHDFIEEAIKKGAKVIVCQEGTKSFDNVFFIFVKDTTIAFQYLAQRVREDSNIPWVALTGSVGKTSTRHVIAKVLSKKGPVLETVKNNNNQLGVPLTVLDLTEKHRFAVVEAGTNHFGEIKPLAEILQPDFALITNIGNIHVEHLIDENGVAREKGELLKTVKPSGMCILNADSLCLNQLKEVSKGRVITFGITSGDVRAKNIEIEAEEMNFEIEKQEFRMPYLGKHFIYNFLPAYIIGKELGVRMRDLEEACRMMTGAVGRLEIKLEKPVLIIDDSYNASVNSMIAAIDFLHNKNVERRILILGDMKELGDQAHKSHLEVLDYINDFPVDLLITLGDEWGKVVDRCGGDWEHFKDKESLIKFCLFEINQGDGVLIKASNSLKFNEVVASLLKKWKV